MPCYSPIRGFRSQKVNESGKRGIVFNRREGLVDLPVDLPCGKCIGCKLEYARQWAMRCVHEASLHEENCFVTLTYSDDFLPIGGSLVKKHFTDFVKRLRYFVAPKKVRFYMCGEYGDENLRPHYHCCLFGFSPNDMIFLSEKNGYILYKSEFLNSVWGMGFVSVGTVTFESAGYCARYATKKLTRPKVCGHCKNGLECIQCRKVRRHYERMDPLTGEITNVIPEYAHMSRGGKNGHGIGFDWISKYKKEVYNSDSVIVGGKEVLPPKYYDLTLSEDEQILVRGRRRRRAEKRADDATLRRLRAREEVKEAQVGSLKKEL